MGGRSRLRTVLADPDPLAPTLWRGLRIGLLGGSFNPAHAGHRHIALLALKRLQLDAVWLLVSPQNPLKPTRGMAPLAERLDSARRVANHPRIVATALESRLGTQFTADTLRALHRRFPGARFVWLMGADNLASIHRWQHWTLIFGRTPVAVLARRPYSLKALRSRAARRYARCRRKGVRCLWHDHPPAWVFVPIPLHPASATAIRRRRMRAAGLFRRLRADDGIRM